MTKHHPDFFGGRVCSISCACGWNSPTFIRASSAWREYNRHEIISEHEESLLVEPSHKDEDGNSVWVGPDKVLALARREGDQQPSFHVSEGTKWGAALDLDQAKFLHEALGSAIHQAENQ